MRPIRNSAKAIIFREGKILLTRNKDHIGEFYLLPGGGQSPGETLVNALKRECLEETGLEIEVDDLRLVREYIACNHEFAEQEAEVHQNEYMFLCRIKGDPAPKPPENPDCYQIGVDWVPFGQLPAIRLYPRILSAILLPTGIPPAIPIYLGDIN